ncbi:MAG TPA: DUF1015 domain-containing protein [Fimbriimonadales bacterium]|nr:DUF1015 domain-containing protein [Fimbriimonadales bacterium]
MAKIRPFLAYRFSEKAGDLENLVAPPYDVISPEERERLAAKSPYNTVWLTLPESLPDDRSKFVKYARSSSRLTEWKREGILKAEEKPGLYLYLQTFTDPLTNRRLTRQSLITLMKLEPYEKGIVLPHEETFPKHKEDRLRLLEATRTHLECIYGLYQDEEMNVEKNLYSAPFETVAVVTTEDEIHHELKRCTDPDAIERIQKAMQPERVWIADGHHRYETALNYRAQMGERSEEIAEDYILIALSSMRDPGLVILPTHRMIKHIEVSRNEARQRLQTYFNVRDVAMNELPEEVRAHNAPDTRVFGVAMQDPVAWLATLEEPEAVLEWIEGDASDTWKMLDVTIAHELILKRVFGVKDTEGIAYTRSAEEALESVRKKLYEVAILMNPPSVQTMRIIAEGGEKMPQKSTYYYPKLLSGLVFWSLENF